MPITKSICKIIPIPYHTAAHMVKLHHYLHKVPPITISLGLLVNNKLAGCITFGNPPNRNTFTTLNTKGLELNRLFIHDWAGHNSESLFIGQSLKYINQTYKEYKAIVAYADPEYGHIGIIYQATNWIYTGTTKIRYSILIDGKSYHERTATRKYGSITNAKKAGAIIIPHKPKHRYVYLLGSKKERKLLRNNLPWKVYNYPK